jgi:MraZ protein
MFRGISAQVLDEKGRINVPSRYREQLWEQSQGQLIISIDVQERCLLVYPFPTWEKLEQKLCRLPEFDPNVRRLQRLLLGHACEVLMDKQGRLLLPQALRSFAGLDKQLYLLGQGEKFEIWDKGLWENRSSSWLANSAEILEVSNREWSTIE